MAILGAGRLATAVARRWHLVWGIYPLLWSRQFQTAGSLIIPETEEQAFSVTSIRSVMAADAVFAAIPGNALVELAANYQAVKEFAGTLLLAGIDRPVEVIQKALPEALIVRVAPFLLAAREDMPCLVLEPRERSARWEKCARAALSTLGPIDLVDDEKVFEIVLHFGSPFPVVLRKALRETVAKVLLENGIHPKYKPVAERLLWQALSAAEPVIEPAGAEGAGQKVATPGGITERGLQEVGGLSRSMADVLSVMIRHAEQIHANKALRDPIKESDDRNHNDRGPR